MLNIFTLILKQQFFHSHFLENIQNRSFIKSCVYTQSMVMIYTWNKRTIWWKFKAWLAWYLLESLSFPELPVQFTETLTKLKVKENDTVTLSCKLNKEDKPVKWLKNGIEIEPDKRTKVLVDQYKHQLIITDASLGDEDTYSCVCGDVSTECTVQVEGRFFKQNWHDYLFILYEHLCYLK